jgi:tetratricopeptide (TPR) repeat protein
MRFRFLLVIGTIALLLGFESWAHFSLFRFSIANNEKNAIAFNHKSQEKSNYTGFVAKIDEIARQISVRIDANKHSGSGTIVAKRGKTYYVLTASHVVSKQDSYKVVAPDGQEYQIKRDRISLLKGVDLAVVSFESDAPGQGFRQRNYQIATLGNYNLGVTENAIAFLSGFPATKNNSEPQRLLTVGNLLSEEMSAFGAQNLYSLAQNSGYKLVYSNMSYPGMSGGALLDSQGRVIGVNAASEGEVSLQSGRVTEAYLGRSLGLPIATFIDTAEQANLQPQSLKIEIARPPTLRASEIKLINESLSNLEKPSDGATEIDWLNYGNQLWRVARNEEAVSAFERAIALKPDYYEAYYGRGLAFGAQNKYQEAFDSFKKATEIDPEFYPAWRQRAANLYFLRKYKEALSEIDRAIALQSDDFVLYWWRSLILFELERYTEATQNSTKAIALNPNSAIAYVFRAQLYAMSNQPDLALADLDRALQINPKNADPYNLRGLIYLNRQQYDLAIAAFDRSLAIAPNNAVAYDGRGRVYLLSGKFEQALADLDRAIQLAPQYAQAYLNRGRIYMFLGEFDKARANLNRSLKINPHFADGYFLRSILYSLSQEYDLAIADLDRSLQYQPDYALSYVGSNFGDLTLEQLHQAMVYFMRGNIYLNQKDFQNALANAERAMQIAPKLNEVYLLRGTANLGLEKYEQAIADLTQALQLPSSMSDAPIGQLFSELPLQLSDKTKLKEAQKYGAYLSRSLAYLHLGKYNQALADLDRAKQIVPNDLEIEKAKGDVYFKMGDYTKAIAQYEKVLSQDNKIWNAYNNLGLVRYEMGEREAAIQQWQKAFEINDDAAESLFALAVATYTNGERDKALEIADKALKIDNKFSAPNYLQKNLWGERLIADARKLIEAIKN